MRNNKQKAWCKAELGHEDIIVERNKLTKRLIGRIKWVGICRLFGLSPRTTEIIVIPIKGLTVLYFGKESEGVVQ